MQGRAQLGEGCRTRDDWQRSPSLRKASELQCTGLWEVTRDRSVALSGLRRGPGGLRGTVL